MYQNETIFVLDFVASFGLACCKWLYSSCLAIAWGVAKNLSYRFDLRFVFLIPIFATSI